MPAEFLKSWLIKAIPNPHVLIVDDERDDIALIERRLLSFECSFESCDNAREAIGKILTGAFHLVFIDVRLRNGTGPEVVARTIDRSAGTHFVLLSGYLYEDVSKLTTSTASVLFLPKPITEEKLSEILKRKP